MLPASCLIHCVERKETDRNHFGKDYSGIDASLARLREKESGVWYFTKADSRLKEELQVFAFREGRRNRRTMT